MLIPISCVSMINMYCFWCTAKKRKDRIFYFYFLEVHSYKIYCSKDCTIATNQRSLHQPRMKYISKEAPDIENNDVTGILGVLS